MLQNARLIAFTVSELLRKNQQEVGFSPSPPRLELKTENVIMPPPDLINLNRAFHQLLKTGYFEVHFIKKILHQNKIG